MNSHAIGIFDSGLGGLTAVRELKKLLPHEHIIYFGDNARNTRSSVAAARPSGATRNRISVFCFPTR